MKAYVIKARPQCESAHPQAVSSLRMHEQVMRVVVEHSEGQPMRKFCVTSAVFVYTFSFLLNCELDHRTSAFLKAA